MTTLVERLTPPDETNTRPRLNRQPWQTTARWPGALIDTTEPRADPRIPLDYLSQRRLPSTGRKAYVVCKLNATYTFLPLDSRGYQKCPLTSSAVIPESSRGGLDHIRTPRAHSSISRISSSSISGTAASPVSRLPWCHLRSIPIHLRSIPAPHRISHSSQGCPDQGCPATPGDVQTRDVLQHRGMSCSTGGCPAAPGDVLTRPGMSGATHRSVYCPASSASADSRAPR